jgi:cell division protein FtsB
MVKTRLFISVYIAFLAYIVLTSVFGPGGLMEYSSLAGYKEALTRNLHQLETIYHDLYYDLKSLKTDAQIVRLFSRDLKYYAKDEYVIRFQGLNTRKISYRVGTILKRDQQENRNTQGLFMGIGIAVFLLVFLFSLTFADSKKHRNGFTQR